VEILAPMVEAMIRHAEFCAPQEACGLVAVDAAGRARMVYCLTNLDASPVSYTLDPAEHIRALYHAERNGWSLGGVFHSHPAGRAVPSATDVQQALEPEWIYLVVGKEPSGDPEVRGYRIERGRATEVPLRVPEAA
jgi:proteasome lid subunit RPN8/RPN11